MAVGIAPTKVLVKLANRWARAAPKSSGAAPAVFDLGAATAAAAEAALEATAIEDVWGIGRKHSRWCRLRGIATARALRDLPTSEMRRRCGVVGVRLQQELRGHACLPLELVPPAKRETCVSRSFSQPIDNLTQLQEAVATYTARAAEKLRRQGQQAGAPTVFVRSSPFNDTAFYANAATVRLAVASHDTAVLLAAALPLAQVLFRPNKPLRKAGVVLQELSDRAVLQHHLLVSLPAEQQQRRGALMAALDQLNRRYGSGTIQWAACGLQAPWRMRRSRLSRAATTRLADIPIVRA